jgi:hypothetical protein
MRRAQLIPALSLVFTAAFFLEYTPVLPQVHIPYDLEDYHYPLADYAFQAIRHGRFPQWDPTIYCGISFVGNVQAAVFYPPQWLMFVCSLGRHKLPYQALEYLDLAHVWLAFLLCYLWLHRQRKLHWLASVLGAGIFAFSGFMMLQLQHFGWVCAYAWMPLGFWGIDEASERRQWRPLWKLGIAFTMCILAGYPSVWIVFAIAMLSYALFQNHPLRSGISVACALGMCFLFAAVQVLPAWEANQAKTPEVKYSRNSGIGDPGFYISYFVPNYFDFGIKTNIHKNPGKEYLYLGAPAFVGLAMLAGRRRMAGIAPPIAVLSASLLFFINPFGLIGRAMAGNFLSEVFSSYYFLTGVTAGIAPLAAIGLDAGLRRTGKTWPQWIGLVVVGLTIGWSVRLVLLWKNVALPVLWRSGIDALVGTILCGALVASYASSKGRIQVCVAAGLILLAGAEYKSFGTSKRFNATASASIDYAAEGYPEINAATYRVLRAHREYRMARDTTGPDPLHMRDAGLTTPQGTDPFVPAQYHILIDKIAHFANTRDMDIDPDNQVALRLLGVRYFGTSEQGSLWQGLKESPRFHLMQPADKYFKIFEFVDAQPAFGWEQAGPDSVAQATAWEPETRVFRVRSESDGVFRLSEQNLPGWKATVDGLETPIERCHDALQCVAVAAGGHIVEFRYRSRWLIPGALVSLFSLLLALAAVHVHDKRFANE